MLVPPTPEAEHTGHLLPLNPAKPVLKSLSGDEFMQSWRDTVGAVAKLAESADSGSTHWAIDRLEIDLTISAEGKLVFIAEASAAASVKLTLRRKDAAGDPDPSGQTFA